MAARGYLIVTKQVYSSSARLMKNRLLLVALVLFVLTSSGWVQNPTGKRFNVAAYGAIGNGTTNDAPACIKAFQAANISGGTVVFPDGTFLLQVGNPTTDTTNYMAFSGGTEGIVFNVTQANVTVELSPKTVLKVVANYLCQNLSGQFASCQQVVFGTTSSPLSNFRIIGKASQITFATDTENGTGVSATRATVLNAANEFYVLRGNYRDMILRDFETQNFPRNIALDGGYVDGSGNVLTDSYFYNLKFTNYGGAGHDLNAYFQGGNTIEDVMVTTSRPFHSHSFYFGAGKPGNRIRRAKVTWTSPDATISNKYQVQSYSESANADVSGLWIEDSEFTGAIAAILVQHNNSGVSGKVVRNTYIRNNKFTGDGTNIAIAMVDPNDCEISGNTFSTWTTAISATHGTVSGRNIVIDRNAFSVVKNSIKVESGITDSTISNNVVTAAVANGISYNCQGARGKIIGNHLINGGGAGSQGMVLGGDGFVASHNEFYSDNGTNFSELLNAVSGDGWQFTDNILNLNVASYGIFAGSNFTVARNTTNQNLIVAASATGVNMFAGNIFTGSAKPIIRAATNFLNNICPSSVSATSGADAAGFLNGTNNILNGNGAIDTFSNGAASGAVALHAGIFRVFKLTATGNITSFSVTNPTEGREIVIEVLQDGTGGRTIAPGASFSTACTPDTTAAKRTTYTFVYSAGASKWFEKTACVTGQ